MNTPSVKINSTSSIGFLIGIGAWSITFVTLIWGYLFYRLQAGKWLAGYIDNTVLTMVSINTAVLLASSYLLHQFRNNKSGVFLFSGILAGGLFLAAQISLWMLLSGAGLTFKDSLAGSFLYLLTGFHAVHVLIGLAIILVFGMMNEYRFAFALRFWDLLAVFWVVLLILIFFIQ